MLGEAATAAAKTDTFLGADYKRLVKRRGKQRAMGRRRPVDPAHRLAHPQRPQRPLRRPRLRLLPAPARPRPPDRRPRSPAQSPRPRRHSHTPGRLTGPPVAATTDLGARPGPATLARDQTRGAHKRFPVRALRVDGRGREKGPRAIRGP